MNELLIIEPGYVPALSELARVYDRVPKSDGMSREQNIRVIHKLADRVVQLEPNGSAASAWQG